MTISSSSNIAAAVIAGVTQEANETAAQTKTEAAKGDRQAIQKLARLQAQAAASAPTQQSAPQPAASTAPGTLDATA